MFRLEEARKKLAWALKHLRANVDANIVDRVVEGYKIQFRKNDKAPITKTVDEAVVDDCYPAADYIPAKLKQEIDSAVQKLTGAN